MMPYLIGIAVGLVTSLVTWWIGLGRDRSFYPTVLIVVAAYYVLFAAMGGSGRAVLVESFVMVGFGVVAAVGFRGNLWLVAAGLIGHGVFDVFHVRLALTTSTPPWWPAFCMAADVALGGFLVLLLKRQMLSATIGAPA